MPSNGTVKTTGADSLFRKFMKPGDDVVLYELQALLMQMSQAELRRFVEGMMNATLVAQDQWRKRFPNEWAAWDREFNS